MITDKNLKYIIGEIIVSARNPEDLQDLIEKAFNEHNLDAVVELYEENSALATPPNGDVVIGKDSVRAVMGNFVGLNPVFEYTKKRVFKSEDIALLSGLWTLKGTGPDGNPVEMAGQTAEVARKQADGTWLYVVDSPFGFLI